MLGVSVPSVKRAKIILADGDAATIEAVEKGKLKLAPTAAKMRPTKSKSAVAIADKSTSSRQGNKLPIPAGMTVSEFCRRGIDLEKTEGLTAEAAAQKIGMGGWSYRRARSIILIAERNDLNRRETSAAQRALVLMNETQRIRDAYALVELIVAKLWGGKGSRRNDRQSAKRVDAFMDAVIITAEACAKASEVEIPHLTQEQVTSALRQIREAVDCLRRLNARLQKEASE